MHSAIYRDSVVVAEDRRAKALQRWHSERAALPAAVQRVHARRTGRVAGGAAGIAVAFSMVAATLYGHHGATRNLLYAAPVALAAYLVGRVYGRLQLRRLLRDAAAPSGDVWRDVERFEGASPLHLVQGAASRLERASVALPMMAVSLCAPLTLHFLYQLWVSGGALTPEAFDEWVKLSTILVGHCHLVLAGLCWRFARRVQQRPTADLAWAPGRDGWSAWGITTASSLFPAVALLFVPLFLVALTGIVFIPAMFWFMSLRVSRERLTLIEPYDALAYA